MSMTNFRAADMPGQPKAEVTADRPVKESAAKKAPAKKTAARKAAPKSSTKATATPVESTVETPVVEAEKSED